VKGAPPAHALFESALGTLALAWSDAGLVGVQLPDATPRKTAAQLAKRVHSKPAPAPAWVQSAAKSVLALAAGEAANLDQLRLDESGVPEFHGRVYRALRKVPAGATCTYKELALAAGSPNAARAVGQAMRRNPWPLIVPCHRVLAAGDRLGGFSAFGGLELKARLLRAEKANVEKPAPSPEKRRPVKSKPATTRRAKTTSAAQPRRASWDIESALKHLRECDPRLAALIERVPCTWKSQPLRSVFEALLRTIVYQQLNGKAAATIHARVLELFPRGEIEARALLALAPEQLRAAGMSGSKVASAIDLARKTIDGELPDAAQLAVLGDEEIVERLTVVRGIGRWSVEMLLMFRLDRPDVLPLGDYGVKNGFMLLTGRRAMPTEAQLERYGERWRPYRSVASWYMWRAVDEHRELSTKAGPAPKKLTVGQRKT
jgi:methylated-DNA-[protein]-cysteine S-methyltransferase